MAYAFSAIILRVRQASCHSKNWAASLNCWNLTGWDWPKNTVQ